MTIEDIQKEWNLAKSISPYAGMAIIPTPQLVGKSKKRVVEFAYRHVDKLLAVAEAAKECLKAERSYPIAPIDKDFQVLAKEIDELKKRLDRLELIHPVPKQDKFENHMAAIDWHQNQLKNTWTKESLEGKEPPI